MKRPSVLNIWQVCDFPVLSLGSVFEANTINTNTFVVGFFVASKTYQRIALSLGNVFVILRTIYLYYRWDMEHGTKKEAVANTFCLLLSGARQGRHQPSFHPIWLELISLSFDVMENCGKTHPILSDRSMQLPWRVEGNHTYALIDYPTQWITMHW